MEMKTALFGGALFAAGITNAAHAAPEFTWDYSSMGVLLIETYTLGGAFNVITDDFSGYGNGSIGISADVNIGGYDYTLASAEAAWDESGWSGYAYANATYGYARVDGYGPGFQLGLHYFTVTQSGTADLTWDFSNVNTAGNYAYGTVRVYDLTNGAFLPGADIRPFGAGAGIDPFAGSVSVNLAAGNDYLLIHGFRTDGFAAAPESMSASLGNLVPTPASAALLGLAGLAGVRRRRA